MCLHIKNVQIISDTIYVLLYRDQVCGQGWGGKGSLINAKSLYRDTLFQTPPHELCVSVQSCDLVALTDATLHMNEHRQKPVHGKFFLVVFEWKPGCKQV